MLAMNTLGTATIFTLSKMITSHLVNISLSLSL